MSDIREVTEWHDAMENTLTVAGERLHDSLNELARATGIERALRQLITRINGDD